MAVGATFALADGFLAGARLAAGFLAAVVVFDFRVVGTRSAPNLALLRSSEFIQSAVRGGVALDL